MLKDIVRITGLAFVCIVVDGLFGLAQTPPFPGPQTPTNLWVTVTHVDLGISLDITPKNILTEPSTIDVVGTNGRTANAENVFGVGSITKDDYKFVHVTLDENAAYSGTNPCTGMPADHAPIQIISPIHIPGGPAPGTVQLNYMVPHPVKGLQAGYLAMQAAQVSGTPNEFRIVFRVSDSIICASSSLPLRKITAPAFEAPAGVAEYPDPLNPQLDKIVVAEKGGNALDVYYRTDSDDPLGNAPIPLQSIHGGGSGLSSPTSVYADPSHTEIGVANNGNDTITYYNWNSSSMTFSSQPSRALNPLIIMPSSNSIQITENDNGGGVIGTGAATISAGTYVSGAELATAVETALNAIPTTQGTIFGVAYDSTARKFTIGVLALASGVDTITLKWNSSTAGNILGFDSVDSVPLGINSSDTSDNAIDNLTGLSQPCGIYYDKNTDEVAVANMGNDSITFYTRTASGNALPIRTIQGNATGLNRPCGIAVLTDSLDPTQGTVVVSNSGNNSITVYDRNTMLNNPDDNVPWLRRIAGSKTEMSNPRGLFVDPNHDEIGVINNDSNTIAFFSLSGGTGDIPPLRTIRGETTALFGPWGAYLDQINDEIVVANNFGGQITVHKREEDTAQVRQAPILNISATEQQLIPQYFYSGSLDGDGNSTDMTPTYDGYNFYWKVTDNRIRQPGDATNGLLIPPSTMSFQLTDGQPASSLPFDCPAMTPFIILEYTTNCPPPLIQTPFPVKEGDYRVASILFTQISITRIHVTPTSVPVSEFPRLVPTVSLFSTSGQTRAIQSITWKYVDQNGLDVPSQPIIYSQQASVNLTRPFDEVSPCFAQVSGNSPQLIFASGSKAPEVRSIEPVLNNGQCEIDFRYVQNINFTVTDALGERFMYRWDVVQ
jgi:Lactonase, 7-bladed beta-propeller